MSNVKRKGNRLFIGKRLIGILTMRNQKKVIECYRDSKKHFFIKFQSWGMAEDAVNWLALHGFVEIHIITGYNRLISQVFDWQIYGKHYQHESFERQLLLRKEYFKQVSLAKGRGNYWKRNK